MTYITLPATADSTGLVYKQYWCSRLCNAGYITGLVPVVPVYS